MLIKPPQGMRVAPNRVVVLNHDNKCLDVYDKVPQPEWAVEQWEHVASIIREVGEQEWFDLPQVDDEWVALAYFWKDVLEDKRVSV